MSLNQQPEPNKNQGQEKKEQESFIPPDLDTELDPEFKAMLDDMLDKPVRTSAKIIIQDIRDSLSNAAQAIGPYAQAARDETLRTGREVTNALINAGKSFWQSSQDIANATAKTTSDAVLSLPKHVVTLMELVGADPEEDRGFFSELGKSLPIIGAGGTYADAFRAYHRGKELGDEKMMKRGEVLCLAAMIDIKLDVVTFGLGKAHKLPRLGLSALQGLTAMRFFNAFSKYNVDAVYGAAVLMHRSEKARALARSTLETLKPKAKNEDQPKSENESEAS